MNYCKNCGMKLEGEVKFCPECGTFVGQQEVLQDEPVQDAAEEEVLQDEPVQDAVEEEVLQAVYEGVIHKCPNCGGTLKALETVCSKCGYELRSVKVRSAVSEFAQKIEQIEALRVQNEWNVPTKGKELTNTDKQKIALIRSFSIPNTKEDLYEFMILAGANIDTEVMIEYAKGEPARAEADAWAAQFERAYKKAQISFFNDADLAMFEHIYREKIVEAKKLRKKRERKDDIVGYGVLLALAVIIIVVVTFSVDAIRIEITENRLEKRLEQVYDHMEEEKYELAYTETANLIFTGSNSKNSRKAKEKWTQIREQIMDILQENMENERKEEP